MPGPAQSQAPSILADTEAVIDEKIAGFGKEVTKLEAAVKAMHGVASDQAAKYRGDQKKVAGQLASQQKKHFINHGPRRTARRAKRRAVLIFYVLSNRRPTHKHTPAYHRGQKPTLFDTNNTL
jgi:hypothetical protein